MKHYKKTITMLLTAAVLLNAVFMTGCTKLSEAPNSTPSGTDAPAESDGFGVYVKLERDDAGSIALHGGSSFTKVSITAVPSLPEPLPLLPSLLQLALASAQHLMHWLLCPSGLPACSAVYPVPLL